MPFAYTGTAWTGGKLPKELLAEAVGSASPPLKYEPVLSLTNQIGHRSKGTQFITLLLCAFFVTY